MMKAAFMFGGMVFAAGFLGLIHPQLVIPKGRRDEAFGLYFFAAMGVVLLCWGVTWLVTPGEAAPKNTEAERARPAVTNTSGFSHVKKPVIGCRSKKVYERLVQIATEDDTQAFEQLVDSGIRSGACAVLFAGDVVYVEDVAWLGPTKVRRRGDILTY